MEGIGKGLPGVFRFDLAQGFGSGPFHAPEGIFPQELVKRGDLYVLRLPLPHIEMGKVEMVKKGDDLIVEVGNFKRNIALPNVLAPLDATVARMVNGALEVTFEVPAASGARL